MEIIYYPSSDAWAHIIQRPVLDSLALEEKVGKILDDIKKNGDPAVQKYSMEFDKVAVLQFETSPEEFEEANAILDPALKKAIGQAKQNIQKFHQAQVDQPAYIETMPGVRCWRKSVGIEKVGLYIPGGTAPLFSTVLMLGIPASIAGCREIILCTPPNAAGKIDPAILFSAQQVGIKRVFKVGGVQAIAAMAYGTASIPRVYKIFGPGNQYVTCAKQLVQNQGLAIDFPAGPSELCVLADDSARTEFVAADLLSQAEHGPDSQTLLVCFQKQFAEAVKEAIEIQLLQLPRKEIAAKAILHSKIVVLDKLDEAINLVNAYAPEHLIISCTNDESIAEAITNAGSVFLGNYAPESVGDYASGTNHTLPTHGYARAYSGVGVDSFVRKISFQKLSRQGLEHIATTVEKMATAEGLDAHARAIRIRLNAH